MKTLTIVLIILASLLQAQSKSEMDYIVILSPWGSTTQRDEAKAIVTALCFTRSAPKSTITVFDSHRLETVARLTVPQLKHDSPRSRRNRMKSELAKLVKWFEEKGSLEGSLSETASLKIPEVLDKISGPFSPKTRLIYIGSPLYRSAKPETSFVDGQTIRIPSTEVIAHKAQEHPFGCIGMRNLNESAVYFYYLSEKLLPSDGGFSLKLEGFLSNYFEAIGASGLYSFSASLDDLWQELSKAPEQKLVVAVKPVLSETDSVEIEVPRTVDDAEAKFRAVSKGHSFAVGVYWEYSGMDLDVWWCPPGGVRPVYFANRSHSIAKFLKDKRSGKTGWEVINFSEKPSLETEIWVNMYRSSGKRSASQSLTYFLRSENRTMRGTLLLPRGKGDMSRGFKKRFGDSNWVRIDFREALSSQSVWLEAVETVVD